MNFESGAVDSLYRQWSRYGVGKMAHNDSPQRQHTYILDSESAPELARLINQHRILSLGMGGLFPEEPDFTRINSILDIACGPGNWVLDVAFDYPEIEVVGIDLSQSMINYALAQAYAQRVYNSRFQVMNVLMPLAFPDESFDMINGRILSTFVQTPGWPALLAECMRILRPGGILRLSEMEMAITNSAAYEQFSQLTVQALIKTGYSFSPDGRHMATMPMLTHFLRKAGYRKIKHLAYAIDISSDAMLHGSYYDNFTVFLQLFKPFLLKMGLIDGEEFEHLYEETVYSMMADDFCGTWLGLIAWGQKAEEGQ